MLLQSILAPQSIKRTFEPVFVGNNGAKAGLETPLILPIFKKPQVKIAPVLPAEIIASASLDFNKSKPTTKDEFGFCFIAIVGISLFSITSLQSTIWSLSGEYSLLMQFKISSFFLLI